MIQIGDKIPNIELRTDEGTPLSLTDLKGRALAVFLLGEAFSPTTERLIHVLSEYAETFLAEDVSPIPVSGQSARHLAQFREQNDVPFLLISDQNLLLHRTLRDKDGNGVNVWLLDAEGVVIDTIPVLPPTELTRVVLERIRRDKNAPGEKTV